MARARTDLRRRRRTPGEKKWEFFTVGGTEEAKATWRNNSWRTGGGGGWMPGAYDPETNTVWWGTANPAPLYDWVGRRLEDRTDRGRATTSTPRSVIALDPDTGKLKILLPGAAARCLGLRFAVGEFVMIERDGKKLRRAPQQGRLSSTSTIAPTPKIENVWPLVKNINFVKGVDPKTGELIGRRDLHAGQGGHAIVPGDRRRHQLELGRLQPEDRAVLQDRPGVVHGPRPCVKTTPILEPMAQLNIGADFKLVSAAGRHGPRSSVAHATRHRRKEAGRIDFQQPPLCQRARHRGQSAVRAGRRRRRACLRRAKRQGSSGRTTTASAIMAASSATRPGGKQYIAVPAGWGSLVADDYAALYGEPFKTMSKNTGALIVFALTMIDGDGGRDRSLPPLPACTDAGMRIPFVIVACHGLRLAMAVDRRPCAIDPGGGTCKPAGVRPRPRRTTSNGEQMFATTCGFCHQDGGRAAGRGPKLSNSERSDEYIIERIKKGKTAPCPPLARCSATARSSAILAYIRWLDD